MTLGQNFPLSDYYQGQILDAETISRGGGWWTAVLLIRDPKTKKPFVGIYRWKFDGETWKKRKNISFRNRRQVEEVLAAMSRLKEKLDDTGNAEE